MSKIEVSCEECEADFEIKHDLLEPYALMYCPFCGERLPEDDFYIEYDDDIEDDDNDVIW